MTSLVVTPTGELSRAAHGKKVGSGGDRDSPARWCAPVQAGCAVNLNDAAVGGAGPCVQQVVTPTGRDRRRDCQTEARDAGPPDAMGRRAMWRVRARALQRHLDGALSARTMSLPMPAGTCVPAPVPAGIKFGRSDLSLPEETRDRQCASRVAGLKSMTSPRGLGVDAAPTRAGPSLSVATAR